jgi:hypothetical protein
LAGIARGDLLGLFGCEFFAIEFGLGDWLGRWRR